MEVQSKTTVYQLDSAHVSHRSKLLLERLQGVQTKLLEATLFQDLDPLFWVPSTIGEYIANMQD